MLHVGCGSVGLIFPCAASTPITDTTAPNPTRIFFICAS
jgi:hypothetical protein